MITILKVCASILAIFVTIIIVVLSILFLKFIIESMD